MQRIREELIPKLKGLCRKGTNTLRDARAALRVVTAAVAPVAAPQVAKPVLGTTRPGGPVDIVAVGVSTGGPNALAELLPLIKGELPVPMVLVQHMPPMFTRLLAERLNAQAKLRVIEAAGGEVLEAGTVYVAPGNFHLVVQRRGNTVVTVLNQLPPENSCRPAVDPLFRSVVQVYGGRVLGVILTGMGQDGTRGCEAIRAAGGSVLAQDEASSVVWGMPGFVARAGLADRVLPPAGIAAEINRRCQPGAAAMRAVR